MFIGGLVGYRPGQQERCPPPILLLPWLFAFSKWFFFFFFLPRCSSKELRPFVASIRGGQGIHEGPECSQAGESLRQAFPVVIGRTQRRHTVHDEAPVDAVDSLLWVLWWRSRYHSLTKNSWPVLLFSLFQSTVYMAYLLLAGQTWPSESSDMWPVTLILVL